jgi:hypothetical protein
LLIDVDVITDKKKPTSRKSPTNIITSQVVSCTPRHCREGNSQQKVVIYVGTDCVTVKQVLLCNRFGRNKVISKITLLAISNC